MKPAWDETNIPTLGGIKRAWSHFHIRPPYVPKSKLFNQCVLPVLTFGAETLTPVKRNINKNVIQRKIEKMMSGVAHGYRVPDILIRHRIRVQCAVETVLNLKWKWTHKIVTTIGDVQ